MTWQNFVLTHGVYVRKHLLAHILGVSEAQIEAVRRTGAARRSDGKAPTKAYAELFSLWHGRAPEDGDWPTPRQDGHGNYEWFVPELTLLASQVGLLTCPQIATLLTERLRKLTGDRQAVRTKDAVQLRLSRLGLQMGDVIGGLTVAQAGAEIGSNSMVYQAIQNKSLQPRRLGRLWVIPHDQWVAWKATRVAAPEGYVRLVSLRERLGITSDAKLPEYASMGYIPTAIRCNPMGASVRSTKFGTWYIAPEVATQLLADRRAGRPMPWFGKPMRDNLKVTWRLLQQRRHPPECETCREIWGTAGSPMVFEDYVRRYPPLAHGAKRHLTMVWHPGLTVAEVASDAGKPVSKVRRAIQNGLLAAREIKGKQYVTRTDATRWRARGCPTGESHQSWIALDVAKARYGLTLTELRARIADGTLTSRTGCKATGSPTLVPRQQCAQLRERQGFTEIEAARRLRVSVPRLRELLKGVQWRAASLIPLVTVQAVAKRIESHQGMTIPEAAKHLRRTEKWVHERIEDGTARVTKARWDARRLYLTQPMVERLRQWKKPKIEVITGHWLALGDAAKLAGVTTAGLTSWHYAGSLSRRKTKQGYRYHRRSVQARARRYWATARSSRAVPPAWYVAEQRG